MSKANQYHISTRDKDKRYCSFDMECHQGSWKIIDAPKVPEWIMNVEKHLGEIINAKENTQL